MPSINSDDCFSAVDTETEEHILSELKRLRQHQSTLLYPSGLHRAPRRSDYRRPRAHYRTWQPCRAAGPRRVCRTERVQREGAEEEDLQHIRQRSS